MCASWFPDNWNEHRLNTHHHADGADEETADKLIGDLWNERLGPQPVIPGGRQVPVVYPEPLPPKYFHVKEIVEKLDEAVSLFDRACPKCSSKLDQDLYCNFCGHLGAGEAA